MRRSEPRRARRARAAVALAAAVVSAACASSYAPPAFEPPGAAFPGVAQLTRESGQRPLRLVATHGMCSHLHRPDGPASWTTRRAGSLARALALSQTPPVTLSRRYGSGPEGPAVERRDVAFETPDGPIVASFLHWGAHADPHRDAIAYDNGRAPDPGQPTRAALNAELRSELLNRCLVDVMVYAGRNGDGLRRDMQAALCDVVGGAFVKGDGDPTGRGVCDVPPGAPPQTLALVGESLGSTVMFDTFAGLAEAGGALGPALSGLRAIYLVSNQLPIIDRANRRAPGETAALSALEGRPGATAGSIDRFLSAALAARDGAAATQGVLRAGAAAGAMEVVGFTDPNDVFSYRLEKERLGGDAGGRLAFHNVLVSNTPSLLGLVADPVAAHQGYEDNPDVLGLLANGRRPPGD